MATFRDYLPETSKSRIYLITCIVNKKGYTGSAVVMCRRIKAHYDQLVGNRHRNRYLQAAWNKYGEENFKLEILELFDTKLTKIELLAHEQHWLDIMETYKREEGYNLSPTAGSNQGCKHSEQARKNNSEARKGKKLTEQHKANVSAGGIGRVQSEETKKKISDAQVGKELTEEHKANIKATHWSKGPNADEISARVAEGNKGKVITEETREKLSKNHRSNNGPQSQEEKDKRSKSLAASHARKREQRAADEAWARELAKEYPYEPQDPNIELTEPIDPFV
jgi:group I intron endonuclease